MRISDWSSDVCSSDLSRQDNGNAVVLLRDETEVRGVQPDFAALARLPYLVSVTAPGDEHDVASRVFAAYHGIPERSEERRVGKECVSTGRSRWSRYH